ncbi:MAG: hypothetical protein K1X78_12630 [Verrucomicrobiaceae bacterium]|nr:hypothetical protein [Verrucomicrobiaceae bacterium]
MARPTNTLESLSLTIAITPQMKVYLEDLVIKGTYGASPAEAARMTLSRAIDDMLDRGSLERRKFHLQGNQIVQP